MIYSTTDVPEEVFALALNGVYAHGELEDFLKYDVLVTDDLKTYYNYVLVRDQVQDKVVPQEQIYRDSTFAMNSKGETKKIWLFIWGSNHKGFARGYAVADGDAESYEFVRKQMRERKQEL
jgi:hypothetical protein